jgi:hypothetical protein
VPYSPSRPGKALNLGDRLGFVRATHVQPLDASYCLTHKPSQTRYVAELGTVISMAQRCRASWPTSPDICGRTEQADRPLAATRSDCTPDRIRA